MSEYDSSFREFGWDDEIQNDSTPFEVLPEGDYRFRVEKFERGRHSGSEKIPPCNKAILSGSCASSSPRLASAATVRRSG